MKSVSILIKPASGMCNMKCEYCFYMDEKQYQMHDNNCFTKQDVIETIIIKFLKMAEESVFFCFQGGEPLLAGMDFYSRVIELQRIHNKRNLVITNSIQTNATLIDADWCRFFKDNNILIGVSLDGIQITHDKYRRFADGGLSFDVITKNINLLVAYKVDFNILTVVNKDTSKKINEIYRYFKDCNYTYQQYIACRDPLFEAKGEKYYSLKPKEYGSFLIELFDLWSADLKKGSAPSIRQFDNYLRILLGQAPENCEQCGNCGITYAIDANGDVYPCDFYMFEEYKLGNVIRNDINQIDERRVKIGFVKKSTNFSNDCRECRFLNICRNGCQRNRQMDAKGQYTNYYCEAYRMFFDQRMNQLVEIAKGLEKNG